MKTRAVNFLCNSYANLLSRLMLVSCLRSYDIQKVFFAEHVGHANKYRFGDTAHIRGDLFPD